MPDLELFDSFDLCDNLKHMEHTYALFAQIIVASNTNTKLSRVHKGRIYIMVSGTTETGLYPNYSNKNTLG